LSAAGIEQAKRIKLPFDCVVVSPLRRALQTYSYSQIETGKLLVSDIFREFRPLGHPSNYLEREVIARESQQQLEKRAQQAIEFLQSLPYQTIGVITHHDFTAEFSKLVNHQKPVYLKNAGFMAFSI
jgi:broad specificity phosphatase PhoE